MKIIKEGRVLGRWNVPAVIGFWLSAIGLGVGAVLVFQVLPALIHGASLPVGAGTALVESTVASLLTMLGFSLMVLGSDPFDDASGDFETMEEQQPRKAA